MPNGCGIILIHYLFLVNKSLNSCNQTGFRFLSFQFYLLVRCWCALKQAVNAVILTAKFLVYCTRSILEFSCGPSGCILAMQIWNKGNGVNFQCKLFSEASEVLVFLCNKFHLNLTILDWMNSKSVFLKSFLNSLNHGVSLFSPWRRLLKHKQWNPNPLF